MSVTRRQIVRAAIDEGEWPKAGYGALDSADRESITADWLGKGGDSSTKWRNAYMLLDEAEADADEIRRATEFVSRETRLFHGGPLWSTPPTVSGRIFELLPYDPDKIHTALNRALQRRVYERQETELTADGSRIYTLGTSPWDGITAHQEADPEQFILDVETVSGSGADQIRSPWQDVRGRTYKTHLVDGVYTIEFSPIIDGDILVTWQRPFTTLTNDTQTTDAPIRYAMWAMLYELYAEFEKQALQRGTSSDQWNRVKLAAEAMMLQEQAFALGSRFGGHRIKRTRRPRRFTPAPLSGLRR